MKKTTYHFNLQNIKELIEICRQNNISSFSHKDFRLKFNQESEPFKHIHNTPSNKSTKVEEPQRTEVDLDAIAKAFAPKDDLTDEEIKYYATPYFDELQAEKQMKAEGKSLKGDVT